MIKHFKTHLPAKSSVNNRRSYVNAYTQPSK
jgi:hypothetical protein